jgi:pimeloyl-ACP methyl ester carboxylesterase
MSLTDAAAVGITHRFVDVGGFDMHIAEAGSGPLVVLLHGFPECWYSWRQPQERRSRPARGQAAARLRSLDATGTADRGQPGNDRLPGES